MDTIIVKNRRVAKYLERKGFPILEILDRPKENYPNWKEFLFEDSEEIRERIKALTASK